VFMSPALARSRIFAPMGNRIGDDVTVALVDDADLSAIVIDRGHNGQGLGALRSFSLVDLCFDGHRCMMASDALIPSRSVAIDPTLGRESVRAYLPSGGCPVTRCTSMDRMLRRVTAAPMPCTVGGDECTVVVTLNIADREIGCADC
jgi:hypothetical protein